MSFFNPFSKRRRPGGNGDPASERLKQEEDDPTQWDERWQLLYQRLVKIFAGRRFDDPEDLALEVVLFLITRGYNIGKPDTYYIALTVADNVSSNERRRDKRRRRHDEFDELDPRHATQPSQHTSLEEKERERLRAQCLREALDKLKPGDRKLFLAYKRCINSGRSLTECAAALGMNEQALKRKAAYLRLKVAASANRCLKRFGYSGTEESSPNVG
jgi:RNA polymerase sigma factor (sigma-70 family)